MKVVKKAVPNRKASAKKNDKAGSKASKTKKSTTAGTKPSRKRGAAGGGGAAGAAGAASDDEDNFVNRRAKKPKTGRIGRCDGRHDDKFLGVTIFKDFEGATPPARSLSLACWSPVTDNLDGTYVQTLQVLLYRMFAGIN